MQKPIGACLKTPSSSRLGDTGKSTRLFGILGLFEVVSVIYMSHSPTQARHSLTDRVCVCRVGLTAIAACNLGTHAPTHSQIQTCPLQFLISSSLREKVVLTQLDSMFN